MSGVQQTPHTPSHQLPPQGSSIPLSHASLTRCHQALMLLIPGKNLLPHYSCTVQEPLRAKGGEGNLLHSLGAKWLVYLTQQASAWHYSQSQQLVLKCVPGTAPWTLASSSILLREQQAKLYALNHALLNFFFTSSWTFSKIIPQAKILIMGKVILFWNKLLDGAMWNSTPGIHVFFLR